jgi:hypothetical protein
MSDEQQEQSAANTTEMAVSQGTVGNDYDPNDVSSYAKEVQALIDGEGDAEEYEEESQFEGEQETEGEESEEYETEEESETESEEGEEEDESQDTQTSDAKNAKRYRIKAKSEVERIALILHKENPKWTLEQSIEAAKKLHPEDSNEHEDNHVANEQNSQIETLESIESKIAQLKEQRKEAKKTFDADLEIELEEQIDELKDRRAELAVKVQQMQSVEEQRFYEQAAKAELRAIEFYPDAANPQTALAKEMARIDKDLIATDNPLIYDPNKAFKVAQMAGNNLAIPPRASQQKQTTVRRVSTRPALQPSSGSTRSSATPVASKLDNPDMSLSEYEALVNGMI